MRMIIVAAALAGCAEGDCPDCVTASLTANGSDTLAANIGDTVSYAWTSANADSASSTVSLSPQPDACGNHDGPWVVTTPEGTVSAQILECQTGTTYTLTFTAGDSATQTTASSSITIAVD